MSRSQGSWRAKSRGNTQWSSKNSPLLFPITEHCLLQPLASLSSTHSQGLAWDDHAGWTVVIFLDTFCMCAFSLPMPYSPHSASGIPEEHLAWGWWAKQLGQLAGSKVWALPHPLGLQGIEVGSMHQSVFSGTQIQSLGRGVPGGHGFVHSGMSWSSHIQQHKIKIKDKDVSPSSQFSP
jgi:hypothetical protein